MSFLVVIAFLDYDSLKDLSFTLDLLENKLVWLLMLLAWRVSLLGKEGFPLVSFWALLPAVRGILL